MFKHSLRIVSGIILLLASAVIARADDYYSYSYNGSGISGSGTVALAAGPSDGQYTVTYIDGQVNNITINGLLQPGTFHNNDNLFFEGDSYLDGQGVSFLLNDGSQVGIYYNSDQDSYYFVGDGNFQIDTGTGPGTSQMGNFAASNSDSQSGINVQLNDFYFAPAPDYAATPEPSSLVLLGSGVLAGAGVLRRRFIRA